MSLISEHKFEESVVRLFGTLAKKSNFAFRKAASGIFEILGNGFILRIRRGNGHRRGTGDFVVTLSRSKSVSHDIHDASGEIGLRNFVEFYHGSRPFPDLGSGENFDKVMTEAESATEKFLIPILLGDANSFDAVRRYVDEKIEIKCKEMRQRFPQN